MFDVLSRGVGAVTEIDTALQSLVPEFPSTWEFMFSERIAASYVGSRRVGSFRQLVEINAFIHIIYTCVIYAYILACLFPLSFSISLYLNHYTFSMVPRLQIKSLD